MKTTKISQRKVIGIGLLEIMLVLSIMSLIITLATRYFIVTAASQKTNEAVEMVNNIATAGERWLVAHNDYSELTSLEDIQNRNFFPETISDTSGNPWGGSITVSGSKNSMVIELGGIPSANCLSLANKLLPATCDPTYKATDFCDTKDASSSFAIKITQPNTCYGTPK